MTLQWASEVWAYRTGRLSWMKVGKRHVRHQGWELGYQWHLRSGMRLCVVGIGHLDSSSWRNRKEEGTGRPWKHVYALRLWGITESSHEDPVCSYLLREPLVHWVTAGVSCLRNLAAVPPLPPPPPPYFPFPAFPLRCQPPCSRTASLVSRLTQLSPRSHHVFPHHGTALAHCSLVLNYQAAPLSWASGFQYLVCWDLLAKLMLLSTHM